MQNAVDILHRFCRERSALINGLSVLLYGVPVFVFLRNLLPAFQQGIEIFLYGVRVQFVQLHSSKIRLDV